jgi:Apx/Shroom domain ASD2
LIPPNIGVSRIANEGNRFSDPLSRKQWFPQIKKRFLKENRNMGRPKKGSNPKKVELSAEQKRFSIVIEELRIQLEKKEEYYEALKEKVSKLQDEQSRLAGEIGNLKGAKKNLENILAGVPAPPEWEKYVKHVEVHHHYYYPNTPYYIWPWWTYTIGGTLQYPTWQTITTTPAYSGNYIFTNGVYSGNASLGNAQSGSLTFTTNSGSLPTVTTNAINLTANCSNVSLASSSFNNGTMLIGDGGLDTTSAGSTVMCSTVASNPVASAPGMTGYMMNVDLHTFGSAYTPTDEQVRESEQFLNSIGFTN